MDTKTVTLTEFLLARIGEDEAAAQAAVGRAFHAEIGWSDTEVIVHIDRWSSRRVLAECEAKRRIVELHPLTTNVVPVDTGPSPGCGCETCHTVTASSVFDVDYVEALGPCETLRALAAVYSDHADYRQEWRV